MLVKMLSYLAPNSDVSPRWSTAGPNTNVTITLANVAERRHIVHSIQWSYSGTPTGGGITIADNDSTYADFDIIAGGPGGFSSIYFSGINKTLTVTLKAGGSGITGKLSVQTTTELP